MEEKQKKISIDPLGEWSKNLIKMKKQLIIARSIIEKDKLIKIHLIKLLNSIKVELKKIKVSTSNKCVQTDQYLFNNIENKF